jgi:hypothetical protein
MFSFGSRFPLSSRTSCTVLTTMQVNTALHPNLFFSKKGEKVSPLALGLSALRNHPSHSYGLRVDGSYHKHCTHRALPIVVWIPERRPFCSNVLRAPVNAKMRRAKGVTSSQTRYRYCNGPRMRNDSFSFPSITLFRCLCKGCVGRSDRSYSISGPLNRNREMNLNSKLGESCPPFSDNSATTPHNGDPKLSEVAK